MEQSNKELLYSDAVAAWCIISHVQVEKEYANAVEPYDILFNLLFKS